MTFWNVSDGELNTTGEMDMGGGNDPIPANTGLKAAIDEIKWDDYEGDEYISARWVVIDGEFKNRKVFHKIRVKDGESKKRDKAIRMLAAIDANAGGQLMKLGREPSDMDLASCLMNKPMAIKVGVWEIDDKKGNWVMAVAPLNGAKKKEPVQPAPTPVEDYDDDIPF